MDFHPRCEAWADDLEPSDQEALLAAIRILRDEGPNLGRPVVDRVQGSRHKNMKELRPGSTGRTEVRVLFAFDKERRAILFVGGDESNDWNGSYQVNIPIADERYTEHQEEIDRAANSEEGEGQEHGSAIEGQEAMTMKQWEKKVLQRPGAAERVAEIEDELRLATGLIALREQAGLSQRELAKRIGISQPRVAAIEQARNVTIDVLNQYVIAVGGKLEVAVVKGHRKMPLLGVTPPVKAASKRSPQTPAAAKRRTVAR